MVAESPERENKKKLAALRKCTVELSGGMNPEDMKIALHAKSMLTKSELQELDVIPSTKNKNLKILLKVPACGLRGFDLFVDALQATSTDNPQHNELVVLLIRTLNNDSS